MSNNQKKPTEYEKYLADIHAKLVTPDEILNAVIKEAMGYTPLSKLKIVAGEVNEVYDVLLSNSNHVIVRISRSENPDFEQEKWAITQCTNIGILVPEIYMIKRLRYNKKLLSICVQQKLEGDTLERGAVDYHGLDRNFVRKIIIKAGETLSKIHSIKTHNFGSLDGKGEGRFESFTDLMSEHVNRSDEFYRIANEIGLNSNSIDKIFEVISNNLKHAPTIIPQLNHGDFGPKHIMVRGSEISGILDWGEVEGHSPINDFAKWDYWFGEELPLEWLKEGYQNKVIFDDNFEWILNWIKLNNGLGVLWWYYEQGYLRGIRKAKNRLLKNLEFYK